MGKDAIGYHLPLHACIEIIPQGPPGRYSLDSGGLPTAAEQKRADMNHTASVAVGVGVVLALLALGGCSSTGADSDAALQIGDCVEIGDTLDETTIDVDGFDTVPCDQPHQGEVYLATASFYPEGDYPGNDAAYEQADTACGPAFEEYTKESYEESTLDFISIYPTDESWAMGDRSVLCLVVTPDDSGTSLERTTGSLQG